MSDLQDMRIALKNIQLIADELTDKNIGHLEDLHDEVAAGKLKPFRTSGNDGLFDPQDVYAWGNTRGI